MFTESNHTHGETAALRSNYSNIRLTGHDFLDVGTGGFSTTNYLIRITIAGFNDEVLETDRGRVFYSSTGQDGNFRVGNLFKVEQATDSLTLNEAFNFFWITRNLVRF